MTSPPAQKALSPSPSSSTPTTSGSVAHRVSCVCSTSTIASVSALSDSGAVSVATPKRLPQAVANSRTWIESAISSSRPCSARDVEVRLLQQAPRDDDPHDLVGTFENLVDAGIAHVALQRILANVAIAPMELQRLVAD